MSVLPRALTLAPREQPDPERHQREEIAWAIDRAYWLSRCQGFAIEQGDDYIGQVDSIEYETRIDVPDFILMRSGRLAHRLTRIPVDDVAQIWPSEQLLVLHRRAT